MRMMATAFYGGSIRVGYLPPNINQTEIRNMPLDVLTVFPNDDFDPKNTTWAHFSTPDERDVLYHYMSPNTNGWDVTDKRSFGGYIVLYVAGRLVTQSPEMTSINVIIESAGNFNFSQINPRFGVTDFSDNKGVLSTASTRLDTWVSSEADKHKIRNVTILQNNINSLPLGGFKMTPYQYPDIDSAEGITLGPIGQDVRKTNITNKMFSTNIGADPAAPYETFEAVTTPSLFHPMILPSLANVSFDGAGDYNFENRALTGHGGKGQNWNLVYKPPNSAKHIIVNNPASYFVVENSAVPLSGTINSYKTGCQFAPNAAIESIVVFPDDYSFINLQPYNFAADLRAHKAYDPIMSQIYALRRKEGTIITYIRLNPNGICTAPPTPTETVIEIVEGMYLEYVQDLPITSPLPVSSSSRKEMRRIKLMDRLKQTDPELIRLLADY